MNRRVLVVAAVGTVALILLWYVALWRPQGKDLDEAEQRREAAAQTNSDLEVTLARLRDLEERRPELEADLAQLRKAVPGSPALASFFLAADDAADRAGIELTTITPSKPSSDAAATTATTTATTATTTGSGSTDTTAAATTPTTAAPAAAAVPIQVSLDVSGGYFQILDFMNRLNAMRRVIVVDSLSMTAASDQADAGADPSGATASSGSSELTTTITARMFTTDGPTGGATSGTTGAAPSTGGTTPTTASSEAPQ